MAMKKVGEYLKLVLGALFLIIVVPLAVIQMVGSILVGSAFFIVFVYVIPALILFGLVFGIVYELIAKGLWPLALIVGPILAVLSWKLWWDWRWPGTNRARNFRKKDTSEMEAQERKSVSQSHD